ncbi:unnamed protein product [Caretta caretta]
MAMQKKHQDLEQNCRESAEGVNNEWRQEFPIPHELSGGKGRTFLRGSKRGNPPSSPGMGLCGFAPVSRAEFGGNLQLAALE